MTLLEEIEALTKEIDSCARQNEKDIKDRVWGGPTTAATAAAQRWVLKKLKAITKKYRR